MDKDVYTKLIRFFHGPFRGAILNSLKVEDNFDNREELKRIIKVSFNIESMGGLTATEIAEVVTETAMIFAIELGIMLPYPGEPDDVDDLTMEEFLELKK